MTDDPALDVVSLAEMPRPYRLVEPRLQIVPVVVDVPHAGRRYTQAFTQISRLPLNALRRSEDAYVDTLFREAVALGAPMLVAEFPRAYLDVNREPYELDPRMFDARLPGFANTRSMRVAGGLGTIPRIVGDGQDIYRGKLPVADAMARIETLYRPYHQALRTLVGRTRSRFGSCILLDAHSMPSSSTDREGLARADVILGDRYGTSAGAFVVDLVEQSLRNQGLTVARNRPYAGGYITEHYGSPTGHVHALQIEICRGLYMDEVSLKPHEGFEPLMQALSSVMAECFAQWTEIGVSRQPGPDLGDLPQAAE
jgi:N-formylglutamate amidohydrolase